MATKRRYTHLSNEELSSILDAHFKEEGWRDGYNLTRLDATHQGGVVLHWIHNDYYIRVKE